MIDTLKKYVSNFIDLSEEDLNALSAFVEIRHFEKKQKIISPGETETYLNLVVKGLVRKYFLKGKEEKVTYIAKENFLANSMGSFLSGSPSIYFVEAIEETTLLSIKKQDLENLYDSHHNIERLSRLVLTSLFFQREKQDYDQIRLSVRERFIQFMQNNADLLQRVPQKYLASYLNIKPETFSRMKHLMKKKY
ncbi:MAG TPA: Crp/Fnr family transcriptional regulator [Puia sp.]|nr:Crp/Fnr family transcriptional regulator [Puia sp.]